MLDARPTVIRPQSHGQWDVLAGVRFLLAWIVACDHLTDYVPDTDSMLLINRYIGSFTAVIGFLVISGFSIAHSIARRPQGFYLRRLRRIYPLYLAAIGISLIPFLWAGPVIPSPVPQEFWTLPSGSNLWGNVFFLQTFAVSQLTSNGVTWTLGIEVFCYAITPWLVTLPWRLLLTLLGVSALLFVLHPLLPLADRAVSSLRFGLPLCLLFWAWLLGFLYRHQGATRFMQALMLGLGCLLLSLNNTIYDHRQFSLLIYVITVMAVIYAAALSLPKSLARCLQGLGDVSYPLYLFHAPVFRLVYLWLGEQSSLVMMAAAIMVSVGGYYAIDVPVQHYFKGLENRLTDR